MKKTEKFKRTDSLWICSENTFRIIKLCLILSLVTILSAFGSRSYSEGANDPSPSSDIKYSVSDGQKLLINSKEDKSADMQQKKITGVVSDQKGNPLPGVNVVVKGTTIGAITDIDGKYSIDTDNQNPTLVFSFIGYVTQAIATDGKSAIDLAMSEDIARLEEVVVIGYGTVKKRDLTGSVSSIQTQDLGNSSVANVGQLMQGKIAGLDITSGEGGRPGAAMEIKIRGTSSLNNTAPLTIIDGMVGDVDMVSPNEIESVDVLKDASAAAIYGSRGANGVIIITTKKGRTGAPSFNYEGYYGISNPGKKLDVLNASDYIDLVYDIQGGTYDQATGRWTKPAGLPSIFDNDDYVRTDRVNMQDELFRSSGMQSHNFDMSGGSQNTKYRLSAGYFNQGSTRGDYDFTRYNLKSNVETRIGKHITIGNNTMFRQTRTKGEEGNIFGAIAWTPYVGVFSEDSDNPGNYSYITNEDNLNDAVNPMTPLAYDFYNYQESKLLTQLYADISIIDGLNFHSQFQYEYASSNTLNYREKDYMNSTQQTNYLEESYTTGSWPKFENYVTFTKALGSHSFSLLGGINYEENLKGRGITVRGTGYGGNSIPVLKPTVGSDPASVPNSNVWENASLSYFGRVNYSFIDRYLLTFNFRADASYKFAPSNRWGYFPSIALAWKLKEEAFLRDVEWLSTLKARISWGKAGNDAIREFLYNSNVYTGGYSGGDNLIVYPFGADFNLTSTAYGSTVNALPSPSIRWEEITTKGIGVDATFFKNKLSLTVDYYDKFTDGILIEVPVPLSTGLTQPQVLNAASVINRGVDLQIGYVGNTAVGFNYSITAVAGYNKNWVESLGDGQPIFGVNQTEVGYLTRTTAGSPIGYFYGYKTDGINITSEEAATYNEKFGTATEAGDYRFKDLNNDGKITDADRTNLGNGMPKWTYGFNASFEYKNFDLRVVFAGLYGSQLVDWNGTYWMEGGVRPFNGASTLLNRWKYDGDTHATLPRAEKTDPAKNTRFSDRYVKDGTYGRLKNLTIGYTIKTPALERVVTNLRIYVSMENLLTVTKYPGFDPEVGVGTNGTTGRGVDFSGVPLPKNYLFGVQLSF